MENITKMQMQKHTIELIDEMMAAPDADTFQGRLHHLNETMETLTFSRWRFQSSYPFSTRFWKDNLADWMQWKYVHGHRLETRWIIREIKDAHAREVDRSELEGEGYDSISLKRIIEEGFAAVESV